MMKIKIIIILLFMSLIIQNADAFIYLKIPNEYPDNSCEIYSNDFKNEFGGEIIFLQPDTYPNISGHFVNKFNTADNKSHYIDWREQLIFHSENELKNWYIRKGIKSGLFNDAKIYNLG